MDNAGELHPSRVALFRAREDAARSASSLRRLGYSVARTPVVEIAPLAISLSRERYDVVLATSANAFLTDTSLDRTTPLYVVGARTARAAEMKGWRLAAPAAPDASRLVQKVLGRVAPGASVLYLAGRDRRTSVEQALSGVLQLEVVEAYAAEARTSWRTSEAGSLASCAAALHYSRRSAALATQLAEAAGLRTLLLGMIHVCLSEDVAAPLRLWGASRIVVAETPDEAALIKILSRTVRVFPSNRRFRI